MEDLPEVAEVIIDPLLIGRPGEGVAAIAPAVRVGRARIGPSASAVHGPAVFESHYMDNLLI
jgi:hypothetical protein